MTNEIPTVEEVYTSLLERIGSGAIEVGAKLPSCRALADEMGSNPSTVNRAIRRLARHGLVRTEPRRGTFLVNAGALPKMSSGEAEQEVRRAVQLARRAGFGAASIREMYESALGLGGRQVGAIGFIECNNYDLHRMTTLIENTTGVALKPVLLDELSDDWRSEYDVLATPMFHLADLAEKGVDLNEVVELNFVPSSTALRELATIHSSAAVAVVAPTERGVERMKALVSQYCSGAIEATSDRRNAVLAKADVIIHPAAIDLDSLGLSGVKREILIDWELDPTSATTFAGRVAAFVDL